MARKKQSPQNESLKILKTYKMYVAGGFPRTESGRFYSPEVDGRKIGNICQASRKDVRNAVVAARAAQSAWNQRSAYNRGQIIYRIAEMLQGRAAQFQAELVMQGLTPDQAEYEVQQAIDRTVTYAGWSDKYQQLFSSVNPVATGHFNFSVLDATGVVFLFANEESPLLGLVSMILPIVVAGNSCVVLASQSRPLSAVTFGEVLNSSDVPGGVVNILTGLAQELHEHVARHLDINAVAYDRSNQELLKSIQSQAAGNVKRVRSYQRDWSDPEQANPYLIQDFCEIKTAWHPIEKISSAGSGY